jgi:hypothetical protein
MARPEPCGHSEVDQGFTQELYMTRSGMSASALLLVATLAIGPHTGPYRTSSDHRTLMFDRCALPREGSASTAFTTVRARPQVSGRHHRRRKSAPPRSCWIG